ncbi:MAG: histidine phosphatase family protein [Acidimicrobiales bacterium]|nr:histidine phosphatase family protein [Acidimicrobiales bacterium]
MEIVFIRHGEPEWVREGRNVDNPPLTARGVRQAEAMAVALAGEHFDEVYCSPLVRARQTAAPLFAALGRSETIDPWLEEIRNPIWQGTPQDVADQAYAEQRRRNAHDRWAGLDGGEPMRDFVDRIHLGCTLFLAEREVRRLPGDYSLWEMAEPERRIALVAHAGTNSVAICHLLGIPAVPWEWDRFVLGHASISRVRSMQMGDGHTFCLTKLSDVEHLTAADRTE